MMVSRVIVPLVLCACLASAGLTPVSFESVHDVDAFVTLYIKLYRAFNRVGNFVFSPTAIEAVLDISFGASSGSTEDAIQRVLWPYDRRLEPISDRHLYTTSALRHSVGVETLNATKIFVSSRFQINSTFAADIYTTYKTEVQKDVNFNDKKNTVATIDNWFYGQTEFAFKDLIKEHDLDPSAFAIIGTVADFDQDFDLEFKTSDTKKQAFYINDKDSKQVDMMHMSNDAIDVHEDPTLDAKLVVLYFKDRDRVLMIWVPNQRNKLEELKKKLFKLQAPHRMSDYLKKIVPRKVNLALPKFKIKTNVNLNSGFEKLGLGEMFTNNAQFPSFVMLNDTVDKMFVSNVTHESYLHIDEDGAEGAGAIAQKVSNQTRKAQAVDDLPLDFFTDGEMRLSRHTRETTRLFDDPPALNITIDHPFLFFVNIIASTSGEIGMLAGQVYDPSD